MKYFEKVIKSNIQMCGCIVVFLHLTQQIRSYRDGALD